MATYEIWVDVVLFGQRLQLESRIGNDGTAYVIRVDDPPTLAGVIESFAQLVVPGFTLRVPAPWDALVSFRLPAFELVLDDDRISLTIEECAWSIVDGVLDITSLSLAYDSAEQELLLGLGVNLLSQPYAKIEWNPVEQPVPPVETNESAFELAYLGLG